MHDLGERMFGQRLRREQPSLPDSEIDRAVWAWLRERPGAEHGDATCAALDAYLAED